MPRIPGARLLAAIVVAFMISSVHAAYDPMLCLVNAARQQNGVGPLGFSQGLQDVAYKQASDMSNTGIVSHIGSDGSNPLTRLAHLGLAEIGENLAGGQTSADWAMSSLMGDQGHRATILDSAFTCFGSANVGKFWAQEFGSGSCEPVNCFGSRFKRDAAKVEIIDTFRHSAPSIGNDLDSVPTAGDN